MQAINLSHGTIKPLRRVVQICLKQGVPLMYQDPFLVIVQAWAITLTRKMASRWEIAVDADRQRWVLILFVIAFSVFTYQKSGTLTGLAVSSVCGLRRTYGMMAILYGQEDGKQWIVRQRQKPCWNKRFCHFPAWLFHGLSEKRNTYGRHLDEVKAP